MRIIHPGAASSRMVTALGRPRERRRPAFLMWGVAASVVASLVLSGCAGTPSPRAPTAGPAPTPGLAPLPAAPTTGPAGQRPMIWLTGYSWQDNTPPSSSVVGEPVVHQQAAGAGTYRDPITVAVPGHEGAMDWPPGTRFYLPSVRRYVIVEDSGAAKPVGLENSDTCCELQLCRVSCSFACNVRPTIDTDRAA